VNESGTFDCGRASLTFSTAINKWLQAFDVVIVYHSDQRRVYPSSGLNTVKSTDNNVELHVIVLIFILDLAYKRRDLDTPHSLLDEPCCCFGFGLTHVCLTEKELSVQVGDIDCVCCD